MSRLETRSEQADVDRALQRAVRHEARRTVSWLLGTTIVTVVVALAVDDTAVPMVVVAFGVAFRPLLAIWSTRPAAGKRLPRPERVYRCDDELEDLKSHAGDVVVHEAWIDTGSRPSAKPRWVAADLGIAVPHRKAVLGRWYFSMLTRHDRPLPPKPVIIGAPAPASVTPVEREPLDGSLLGELGWRCAVLSGLAVLAWWVT